MSIHQAISNDTGKLVFNWNYFFFNSFLWATCFQGPTQKRNNIQFPTGVSILQENLNYSPALSVVFKIFPQLLPQLQSYFSSLFYPSPGSASPQNATLPFPTGGRILLPSKCKISTNPFLYLYFTLLFFFFFHCYLNFEVFFFSFFPKTWNSSPKWKLFPTVWGE